MVTLVLPLGSGNYAKKQVDMPIVPVGSIVMLPFFVDPGEITHWCVEVAGSKVVTECYLDDLDFDPDVVWEDEKTLRQILIEDGWEIESMFKS